MRKQHPENEGVKQMLNNLRLNALIECDPLITSIKVIL